MANKRKATKRKTRGVTPKPRKRVKLAQNMSNMNINEDSHPNSKNVKEQKTGFTSLPPELAKKIVQRVVEASPIAGACLAVTCKSAYITWQGIYNEKRDAASRRHRLRATRPNVPITAEEKAEDGSFILLRNRLRKWFPKGYMWHPPAQRFWTREKIDAYWQRKQAVYEPKRIEAAEKQKERVSRMRSRQDWREEKREERARRKWFEKRNERKRRFFEQRVSRSSRRMLLLDDDADEAALEEEKDRARSEGLPEPESIEDVPEDRHPHPADYNWSDDESWRESDDDEDFEWEDDASVPVIPDDIDLDRRESSDESDLEEWEPPSPVNPRDYIVYDGSVSLAEGRHLP